MRTGVLRGIVLPSAIVAAALAWAVLAGCGGDGEDGRPLAIYAGEWNGDDALLVGTLALRGPCLYIVDPAGYSPARTGKPLLLAFGRGTAWDSASETVSYAGREVRVGEVVQVGGSAVRRSAVSTQWLVPPDPECESDVIWFVGEPFPAK